MKRKLDNLKFGETIKSGDILPGIEAIMGENMRFVGKSYIFEGDNKVLQTVKIWATGFNPDDYEGD